MELLIIDDEPILIKSLLLIDWKSLGFSTVYTASSAKEAVAYVKKENISIIISDIQMPGMSGLEMYQQILEKHPSIQCIFLSGYSEFTYAQKAVSLHAVDYLTKPIREHQLIESINKAILSFQAQQNNTLFTQSHRYMLLENYLKDKITLDELTQSITYLTNEKWLHHNLLFCIHASLKDVSENILQNTIESLLQKTSKKYFSQWSLLEEKNYYYFLAHYNEETVELKDLNLLAKMIQLFINETLTIQSKIYIYDIPFELKTLKKHYVIFKEFIHNVPNNEENLYLYDSKKRDTAKLNIGSLYSTPTFNQLFEVGNFKYAHKKLDEILAEINDKHMDTEATREIVFYTILTSFSYLIYIKRSALIEKLRDSLIKLNQHKSFLSSKELIAYLKSIISTLEEEADKNNETQLVDKIHHYIIDHIDKDMSLKKIADYVNYHPAYISKLYKQKTGRNIKEFILHAKIEQAKSLLKNPKSIFD